MVYEERGDQLMGSDYDFAGYTVYDMHYEKIGEVGDLFVDESDRLKYMSLKMGFLGTKTALIPLDLVRVNDKRRLVEVATDKAMVEKGPTFGDDREITPEFEWRILSYYGVGTSQPSTQGEAYGAYYSDAAVDERVDLWPGERAGDRKQHSDEEHPGRVRGGVTRESGSDELDDENELRVQRVEEELRAGTREREAGRVNVRKRAKIDIPVSEEDVRKEKIDAEDQTERRGALRRVRIKDEKVRHPPQGAGDQASPEEEGELDGYTHRKEQSSKKGQQQRTANTKAAKGGQKGLSIEGYDDLTVEEAKKKLGGLSVGELKEIRSYEKKHKNRKTLVEWFDRTINNAS
ncbi:MAG: PRC-barrel domain-containing protein [Actinobacteria bacterium]|nr:PRC-barrel domain-containing protein [Actinomycetota bacterium]